MKAGLSFFVAKNKKVVDVILFLLYRFRCCLFLLRNGDFIMNKNIKTKLLAVSFAVGAVFFGTEGAIASNLQQNDASSQQNFATYSDVVRNKTERSVIDLVILSMPLLLKAAQSGNVLRSFGILMEGQNWLVNELGFSDDVYSAMMPSLHDGMTLIPDITVRLAEICDDFNKNYQPWKEIGGEDIVHAMVYDWVDYFSSKKISPLLEELRTIIAEHDRRGVRQVSAAGSNQFSLTETAAQRLLALLRQGQRDQQRSDKNIFDAVFGKKK